MSSFDKQISISIALHPSYNLSKCSSKKTQLLSTNLIPSQIPSPNKKPLSKTEILASSRLKNDPLI